uniref:adenylate kinase n=1 Tax=Oryza glumipatula TaxID=40148 RepID=A0A0E0A6F3_9ORYZ
MSTAMDDPDVLTEKKDINENMLGGKKVVLEVEKELSAAILTMIDTIIKEGKIVPSEITIKLLQEAIIKGGNDKYIIDGFPRNEENRVVFESVTLVTYFQLLQINISPEFVLFSIVLRKKWKGAFWGRSDDNIETIRKRLKVFVESSLPVIEYYESKGMVKKIDATKPAPEVFEDVKAIFTHMA